MPNASGPPRPLLLERSDPDSPVRRALRLAAIPVGLVGACLLCYGLYWVWLAAEILFSPGSWGLAAPAVAITLVFALGVGVVCAVFGAVLLAAACPALDLRAWRRRPISAGRRPPDSPDPEQLHRPRVPLA